MQNTHSLKIWTIFRLGRSRKGFGKRTASRVAGSRGKLVLDKMGIDVIGFISASHGIKAKPITYEMAKENYRKNELNCPILKQHPVMIEDILKVKAAGEPCGGIVEIIAKGVPAGLGEPVFDKLEAKIAHVNVNRCHKRNRIRCRL